MAEETDELLPEELIAAFSRCQNYPKDRASIQLFAQALKRAADNSGIPMPQIVETCLRASNFCPTDRDLFNVAGEIRERRNAVADQKRRGPRFCSHQLCDGSGWRDVYYLWTMNGTNTPEDPLWTKKEIITREQYEALSTQIGSQPLNKQSVHAARYRCKCHPARAEEIEKRGRYA